MKKGKRLIGFVILFIIAIFITIGYSVLSSTLNISGTSQIKTSSWSVHFANIQITSGSVTATSAPTIDASGLNISYAVTLNNPGDFYEFSVDVVNDGSVDAAMSSLPTLSGVSSAQDVYTNFTFKHSDGTAITTLANEALANTSGKKTYKVRVEFDSNITSDQLPTANQTMSLKVALAYEQAS